MARFLKKKNEQSTDSSVSSIPVPPADSALVIDLPEGQKLVLGKMEEGTVIEVATWRGTGRPDSRTNRLMLGVSFGGSQTADNSEDNPEQVVDNTLLGRAKFVAKTLGLKLLTVFRNSLGVTSESIKRIKSSKRSNRKEVDFQESYSPQSSTQDLAEEDFDIDEWLTSIRKSSRTQKLLEKSEEQSANYSKAGGSSLQRRKPSKSPKSTGGTNRSKRSGKRKKS